MKKLLILLIAVILIFGSVACYNEIKEESQEEIQVLNVVMVTSEGGLGDESFNDMAYEGVLRAASDYDIEVSVIEPENPSDYISSLSDAASEGADLIIAVGYVQGDEMTEIAEQYPETYFAVVDSDAEAPENVMSLSFKEQEGSFLVGVIAALTTETDIVGFIGGGEEPTIEKFEYGFRAGVKAINPDAQVLVDYTECFDDQNLGRETALALIEGGADVIYHASGECGIGVIEAAGEKGVWAIGVDQDQSDLNPEAVLCSMFKRVDNAVYLAIQSLAENDFDGGIYEFGLDFEAVGYSDGAGNLPEEIRQQADAYASAILAGDIYVPKDRGEFEGFVVPEEGLL